MKTFRKYSRIWWVLTTRTTQIAFASRAGAAIFVVGKILRFFFFLLFLTLLVSKTHAIAHYAFWQIIFFYATYNLIDTLPQFFFREVYRFRGQILNGYFDHILLKPFSPLYKALMGGADLLDLSILILSAIFLFVSFNHIGPIPLGNIFLYIILIINAVVIAAAFHICVLGLCVITTEIDNTIQLYRDVTQMGRFPIEIYREPLRSFLTFVIPVGIMMTFPVKTLFGLLTWQWIVFSFWFGIIFLFLSLKFWQFALRHYSSASS